ncbi:peptidoglycan-binding protein LysM [Aureimonas endophytica]|uniref:Peptidoglycan-binding protein LysM n=1 Tax=Aureimonas endophytica TaxID=2027858 RepID=A0A916ZCB8_9HYPH|nr:Ig-like domain-containing protein [Aureimonas endophytica]GGD85431.1 peptidoglycan-binding protein LysM [Aureimonas endophytica]
MSRKFSVLVVFCLFLLGAILAGYWDMLSSERLRQVRDRASQSITELAETARSSIADPAPTPTAPAPAGDKPAAGEGAPSLASATPAPVAEAKADAGAGKPAGNPDAPSFDILRVEPDGSAVIAGRAKPGSEIRLLDGEKVVGSAKASAEGEFAIVLDQRLAVGDHQLRIEAAQPDGRTIVSADAAIVSVPQPHEPEKLLAMIETPGQPSRLIAVPKAEPAAPPATDPAASTTVATAMPAPTAPSAAPPASSFAVDAVEIENGRIYVAGQAAGSQPVRVYVDDRLAGEDRRRANGRFLVTATLPLGEGEHRIRADMIGPNGAVASRVEVPFVKPHGDTMSAVAAAEPRTVAPEDASGAAAGVATATQPAMETVQARVLIRRGDSLWRISRKAYGQGRRYTVIYLANGDQIRNPNRIYPGQLLQVPKDEAAQATPGETATR